MNNIAAIFKLIISRKYKYLYASLRRRFIFYFFRGYFNRQALKRKGACFAAGHCCRITMPWCVYFKNGKCAIYHRQPFFCRVFPIDKRDQELSCVTGLCGYYFE